jgi:hypothetical protein
MTWPFRAKEKPFTYLRPSKKKGPYGNGSPVFVFEKDYPVNVGGPTKKRKESPTPDDASQGIIILLPYHLQILSTGKAKANPRMIVESPVFIVT